MTVSNHFAKNKNFIITAASSRIEYSTVNKPFHSPNQEQKLLRPTEEFLDF